MSRCSLVLAALVCLPIAALADTTAYYRFEGTTADENGGVSGTLVTNGTFPAFSTDVPVATIPQSGAPNAQSISFNGNGAHVQFIGATFPFNVPGPATVEFYVKNALTAHQAIFWARSDGTDCNRFHFYVNADHTIGVDYREPGCALHGVIGPGTPGGGVAIQPNVWAHIALTRAAGADPTKCGGQPYDVYSLYVNTDATKESCNLVDPNFLQRTQIDCSPHLPNDNGWGIASRPGFAFSGLVDEVRFNSAALACNQLSDAPGVVPKGGACSTTSLPCASGLTCTDGVCCDSAGTACANGSSTDCWACSVAAGGSSDGTCTVRSAGASCDDGLSCTSSDVCDGNGACGGASTCAAFDSCHLPGSCGAGGCGPQPLASGYCYIGGACVAAGASDPANACEVCDPAQSTSAYSPKPPTASCDDGRACTAGDHCDGSGGCVSGASTCTAPDACHIAGACTTAGCGAGALSEGFCFIGGACVAAGAADPSNACMVCDPSQSTGAYVAKPATASCDDGLSCTAGDHCDGSGACLSGASTCTAPDACHTAGACGADGCGQGDLVAGACFIDGACYAAGDANPAMPCQVCDPSHATGAWWSFSKPPTVTCTSSAITVQCAPENGELCSSVPITTVTATDNCGAPLTVTQTGGPFCAVGETDLTYSATDAAGQTSTCTNTVIVDPAPPPAITDKLVTLWPPNHAYVRFDLRSCIAAVSDACDSGLTPAEIAANAQVLAYGADEPQSVAGSGNTSGDLVWEGGSSFLVRPERAGTQNGRVYSIWFAYGGTTSLCQIAVPHDKSSRAVDDGVGHGWCTPSSSPLCAH